MGKYTQARRRGNGVAHLSPFPLQPPYVGSDFDGEYGGADDLVQLLNFSLTTSQGYQVSLNAGATWAPLGALAADSNGQFPCGATGQGVQVQARWTANPDGTGPLSDWSETIFIDIP